MRKFSVSVVDENGYSTVGMVLALLLTLALVFTTAQVYEVNTASAGIQEVADSAACAAVNVVAEYHVIERVCDAIILSFSLTSLVLLGIGTVALCVPSLASLGAQLLKASSDVRKQRDIFANHAADSLNRLQKTLPFLAAARSMQVLEENSGGTHESLYRGVSILIPLEGEPAVSSGSEEIEKAADDVESKRDALAEAARQADEAAKEAEASKQRAFDADCGAEPSYCMYERALNLADLHGLDNPLYSSVDTWHFSVALERARAYYAARFRMEKPEGSSVASQADSALRKVFYRYAIDALSRGHVTETDDTFDADFPLLPSTTDQMKQCGLLDDPIYPITAEGEHLVMHAWDGCPAIDEGIVGRGSASQMESDGRFSGCPDCSFSPASLGAVASASTNIDNGFEHHYRIVAEQAEIYEEARRTLDPKLREAKQLADGAFSGVFDALSQMAGKRLEGAPPGRFGAVTLVADVSTHDPASVFPNGFVGGDAVVGTRVALSAATLVEDTPEEGKTVLSSLLDGFEFESGGFGLGVGQIILDSWSGMLGVYADGQESFVATIRSTLASIPLASASGLGDWAAETFEKAAAGAGLEPADLSSPKAVVVSSAHLLSRDDSAFSARLLSVRDSYLSTEGEGSGTVFDSALSALEKQAFSAIDDMEKGFEIASIELLGPQGPSIPLVISLPSGIGDSFKESISGAFDALQSAVSQIWGMRRWQ